VEKTIHIYLDISYYLYAYYVSVGMVIGLVYIWTVVASGT
jgi:hypothetical protein